MSGDFDSFKAGDRVKVINMLGDPGPFPSLGDLATVMDPPYSGGYLQVKWDKPLTSNCNGGWKRNRFALLEPAKPKIDYMQHVRDMCKQ